MTEPSSGAGGSRTPDSRIMSPPFSPLNYGPEMIRCARRDSNSHSRGPKPRAVSNCATSARLMVESVTRIGLVSPAWQAGVLPLNYTDSVCFVGVEGLEPPTSSLSVTCSYQLSHTPL